MSAYELGYSAYHDMACITDNPYNPYGSESLDYDLWVLGWRHARDDYEIS